MNTKTVNVPAINCGHCTHTIEAELAELDGVTKVTADESNKDVMVEWQNPTTWETIRNLLVEIDFTPSEIPSEISCEETAQWQQCN